jgi:N-acetylneuraminate lyase
MSKPLWITGIVPAVFTPLHTDGSLNLSQVSPIVERLVAQNASALYVCGATGEGVSLTREERMAVAESYILAAAGRLPVVVQVGHDSLGEARLLAAHAQACGASAISAIPPLFFKVDRPDQLLDCLAEICTAAPGLPFYYYHIPRLTATRIDVVELLCLASARLPALCGIKYSDFTIFELQACVELENGRFNILFGSDEMLLSGLIGGAQGAVGTTYSFALPLYQRIFSAFHQGRIGEAQRLQSLSVQMMRTINRYATASTNLPAMKSIMRLIGLDCGPLRLPLPSLTTLQEKELAEALNAIGFFEWGN